ncbi:uncharacterized protein LOC144556687 isoform X2 [Carex rostrata]
MADDRIPEQVEEREGDDEEEEEQEDEDDCTSSDRGEEEEESSGYFSRMLHKKIGGGDDLEVRIEVIDKEEESLESRMVIRERTAEQVNRSMIFLSVNLEFVAGIYAYLRIRSRNLSWKGRAIRILPMFLVPALASFFYSLFSRFTSMLNLRDSRLLERLRKEREAKIQELKERAKYYMAKRHIQKGHGESSSTASSLGSNLPETSNTRDKTVNYNLLRGKSRQLHPDTSTDLDACKSTVNDENGKKKLRSLIICSNCRMHNGFAGRDELQFISYKCPHCNALNGPNKEQKGSDSASTSGEGAPQSQPYNPFSMQEMPRGIFIEEITPNHETTDPEMDHPIMIIRESPSLGGGEELPSAFTPVTLRKLPSGLSIEEMTLNEERTAAEMEPPVLIIPESPAAVTSLMVPEMARGLSIEEISPNDQQIEDHDVITPVVFVQEPSLASGQVELLSSQNSGTVTPVTVPEMPSGLSIVEMTPNQETTDPEMEPPVMIIRESPSAGAPVMGDSSFITPLMVQEMGSGLSIEEVSSNHQFIDDREMNPPVMFVQYSPSLGSQELSMSIPDPAAATSVTVPEMSGFSIEELSPNQKGNEDNQTDPPVMIVQESPSVGGPSTVTPLEVPEPLADTINPDGSVRSPNDSVSWSTPGSSTITGSSGRFQDLTEIGQEEIYDNDVPGSSDNESLDADGPHGSVNATGVTGKESLTASHLQSENESGIDYSTGGNYESDSSSWRSAGSDSVARNTVTVSEIHPGMGENLQGESQQMDVHEMNVTHPDTDFNSSYSESEIDSDYGSLADVNEEEATQDLETRDTAGGVAAGSSATDPEQNSRNAEEQNELFSSVYDDSMDTDNDFMGSSAVNGDEEQWSNWQRSEPVTTTGTHPLEETQLIDEEMPPTEARDAVEELEEMQQEDYTGHDDPNPVGSLAYDRDKGSAPQISRKGVGGMKADNVIQDKKRREDERVEEIPDKEGSVKKQGIKPEPVAKASAAPLFIDPGLDPQSIPFTGIVTSPTPQWGPIADFEPPRAVGLRHRK